MELEFERETLDGWEKLAELSLCQEETQETIVPDACPDILRIIGVSGQAILSSKQAREGSAAVSGAVRLTVLYQPEGGGGLCRMESSVPFTCQAEVPGLTVEGKILACPRLKRAEARVLNPRKLLLRVEAAVEITACWPVHRELCKSAVSGAENGVCQQQTQCEDYSLTDVEEKPFVFQDQIRLKANQGEPPRLLDCRVQPLCTECRRIGGKLIFKGTAETALLLQEPDGTLTTGRESLPFSQVLELSDGGEDGDCQVWVEVTGLRCAPDPDDRLCLQLELDLLAQAQVSRRRTITLLRDLYSTARQTDCKSERQIFCHRGEESVIPQAVRELIEVGESVHSVVDSTLWMGELSRRREERELIFEGEATVSVLYLDGEDRLQWAEKEISVSCRVPCEENVRCSCRCICPGEVYAAPSAGGIEVRFNVEFHCMTACPEEISVLSGAELGAERGAGEGRRPSMVLRLAAPGEGLWEIAKAYGTTMEQIIQANELESDRLPAGMMLLIPGAG